MESDRQRSGFKVSDRPRRRESVWAPEDSKQAARLPGHGFTVWTAAASSDLDLGLPGSVPAPRREERTISPSNDPDSSLGIAAADRRSKGFFSFGGLLRWAAIFALLAVLYFLGYQLDDVKNQVRGLRSERGVLVGEKAALVEKKDQLSSELGQLETDLDGLQTKFAETQKFYQDQVNHLKVEVAALDKQKNQLAKDLENERVSATALQEKLATLSKDLDAAKKQSGELLAAKTELENKVSTLETSLAESEKAYQAKESALQARIANLNKARTEMESTLQDDESGVKALEVKLVTLTKSLLNAKKTNEGLEGENQGLEDTVAELRQAVAVAVEQQKSQETSLNQRIGELGKEVEVLQGSLSTEQKTVQALQDKLAKTKGQPVENSEVEESNALAKTDGNDQAAVETPEVLSELEDGLEDVQNQIDGARQLSGEFTDLLSEVDRLQNKAFELTDELGGRDSELDKLEQEELALQEEARRLEQNLTKERESKKEIEGFVQDLRNKLDALREDQAATVAIPPSS